MPPSDTTPPEPERDPDQPQHSPPVSGLLSERDPNVTMTISLRTIGIVVGIWLMFWIVRELTATLLLFASSVLLATAIDKPASQLQSRGLPRGLSILALFAIIIGVLTLVVVILVPLVTNEIGALQGDLADYEAAIQTFLNKHGARVHLTDHLDVNAIATRISNNIGTIASSLTSITLQISHGAVLIFAMVVISFMLASNPSAGARFTARFMNQPAHSRLMKISGDIHNRIGGWVRGQLIVAMTFGIAFGIGLRILGIPYSASLGLTAAALEVIPYLGGAITVVLAVGIALSISLPHAVAVIILYVILINIESHILAPKFIGEAVGLPSVVVLGSLLVGLEWKGILGVLLAVPAVLVIAALLDEFWPSRDNQENLNDTTSESLIDRVKNFFLSFGRHS